MDYAIVGGGIVGLAIASGLRRLGRQVEVFDEGDFALRASRGNFGLVWVQGKGQNQPLYARWTQESASAWPDFARWLEQETGVDIALRQHGGYDFHLSEASLANRVRVLSKLRDQLDGDYPFDVLDAAELRREEPQIGPQVVGAVLHHQDGHVNPLRLLRALATLTRRQQVQIHTDSRIETIDAGNGRFQLTNRQGTRWQADRVVLCAGLGAATLGPSLGFIAPVRPQRGQILVTEKLPPLMQRPASGIRQVDEGSVQIGVTAEEVGFDDSVTVSATARMARTATQLYPCLANVNLVRSWAALRIMSPDGLPIYQQSDRHPGAFMATCHSGITLAAVHALRLPAWFEGQADAPDLDVFSEDRFAASQAAGSPGGNVMTAGA